MQQPLTSKPVRRGGAVPIVITVLGVVTILFIVALIGAGSPATFIAGAIPSTAALIVCLLCYRWLDRWEPEPIRLTVMALIWGGSAAVIFSFLVEMAIPASEFATTAIVAPIVEEFAKASVFVIVATGIRKRELTSLTDHIYYAGICALGFAFVENLGYFALSSSTGDFVAMVIVRTGFGVFGHPLYTTATAVGIWAWRTKGGLWKAAAGYIVACLLHGLWNGGPTLLADSLGLDDAGQLTAMILVYIVLFVPVFIGTITMTTRNRRNEYEAVRSQLPLMVEAGLVTPIEADMIADPRKRRAALAESGKYGRAAKRNQKRTITAVTEAALAQHRIAAGEGGPELVKRRDQLSEWLRSRPDKLGQRPLMPPLPPMQPPTAW
ncbi:PrsW family intramembrane metalloprotease [Cutibacterium sp. WCA-380-WT-3A]|uniref:PrsW family intramembrane metalloprotease n=1 Tax=Cutibacterium porci TaxID=2605781 RepID=A0A7K0J5I0_9ACTN|nr:PrsW family intramembrane metalloprotease [Cutibacterium porci]MSS45195.1 PrsW family intramembrane metalloprotease [Cutibacterium porci]